MENFFKNFQELNKGYSDKFYLRNLFKIRIALTEKSSKIISKQELINHGEW